jgi:hypothetical protein
MSQVQSSSAGTMIGILALVTLAVLLWRVVVRLILIVLLLLLAYGAFSVVRDAGTKVPASRQQAATVAPALHRDAGLPTYAGRVEGAVP